jgi:putative PIN family toxin of toxin-antitoxin system
MSVKVFLDTNVLFSSVLSSEGTPMQAYRKAVTPPSRLYICEQTLEELNRTFKVKFPDRVLQLQGFLESMLPSVTVVPIPAEQIEAETLIRDESDRPIFRAAIAVSIDVFVTGDKDFLESGIINPIVMTPIEFIRNEERA